MVKKVVEISFYIEVDDEDALRNSAYQQALDDGLNEDDANEYLDKDVMDVDNAVQMVLDPGSIPGCTIVDVVRDWNVKVTGEDSDDD